MSNGVQLIFGGFSLGVIAAVLVYFVVRWHREEKERKEERMERLEKWSYDNERELSRLKGRVVALEALSNEKEGTK
jgi:high-affinity Fe2+/Pb2+ permease